MIDVTTHMPIPATNPTAPEAHLPGTPDLIDGPANTADQELIDQPPSADQPAAEVGPLPAETATEVVTQEAGAFIEFRDSAYAAADAIIAKVDSELQVASSLDTQRQEAIDRLDGLATEQTKLQDLIDQLQDRLGQSDKPTPGDDEYLGKSAYRIELNACIEMLRVKLEAIKHKKQQAQDILQSPKGQTERSSDAHRWVKSIEKHAA